MVSFLLTIHQNFLFPTVWNEKISTFTEYGHSSCRPARSGGPRRPDDAFCEILSLWYEQPKAYGHELAEPNDSDLDSSNSVTSVSDNLVF